MLMKEVRLVPLQVGLAHEESSGVTKFLVLEDSLVMDSDALKDKPGSP